MQRALPTWSGWRVLDGGIRGIGSSCAQNCKRLNGRPRPTQDLENKHYPLGVFHKRPLLAHFLAISSRHFLFAQAWAYGSPPAICIECRINPPHRKTHSLGNRLHRIAFINQLTDSQVKLYLRIVPLGFRAGGSRLLRSPRSFLAVQLSTPLFTSGTIAVFLF